jgi:hypothetical protein
VWSRSTVAGAIGELDSGMKALGTNPKKSDNPATPWISAQSALFYERRSKTTCILNPEKPIVSTRHFNHFQAFAL